jgi:TolB-like protein/DNA-binding winged helix-turn-helix (wHTH) protein
MLRVGAWCVNPASGQISRGGETARLEARTMRLLLCLAEHAGEVVGIDDLIAQVWAGVIVTPDSVYQAVASLRRLLGDDPKQPQYIATVPRLGYRMVATVGPWVDSPQEVPAPPPLRPKMIFTRGIAATFFLALVIAFLFHGKVASEPQQSIAVLPFLDLTDAMSHPEFADGMTEELIDKLSKVPGFRVPGPTSSFYFRGKRVLVPEVAKMLGVAYVLDGSVRKSGPTVRIAARLIRADSGYVVWSETYDQPFDDLLRVQDDIAGKVTKALRASIAKS